MNSDFSTLATLNKGKKLSSTSIRIIRIIYFAYFFCKHLKDYNSIGMKGKVCFSDKYKTNINIHDSPMK